MANMLNVYRKTDFTKSKLRVSTPNPTEYHDAGTIKLELDNKPITSKMPRNGKFGALRGVMVPRATLHGASMGVDHEKPLKAYIDPELTNKQLVVDLSKMRENPEATEQAYNDSQRAGHAEHSDAVIDAFSKFATDNSNPKVIVHEGEEIIEEDRSPPLQMQGTYVVPKSTLGGSQIINGKKVATFGKKSNEPVITKAANIRMIPTYIPEAQTQSEEVPQPVPIQSTGKPAKSLRAELEGHATVDDKMMASSKSLRKVVFEIPMPGVPNQSIGRFETFYHDIIREDVMLILVYDHNQPTQSVYFPEPIDDPQTHEQLGLAIGIYGQGNEIGRLLRGYPTGIKFKYQNKTFCILTVEQERQWKPQE